ncbi:MAG: copper resistance protein NlpE [Campylobacterota bacterium]
MQKFYLLLTFKLIFLFFMSGCAPKVQLEGSAKLSLDYEGVYYGVLPCANCEGIKTTVAIKPNERYELSMIYLGKQINNYESVGVFIWDSSGNKIYFDDGTKYFVSEDYLLFLDSRGQKIEGPLAKQYRLERFNLNHVLPHTNFDQNATPE